MKGFKEIRICRAMDQLPRHPFNEDEYVKGAFYCDKRDRATQLDI